MYNVRSCSLFLLIPLLLAGLVTGCASNPKDSADLQKQKASVEMLEKKAAEAMEQGNSSDALYYFQQISELDPSHLTAKVKSGQIYLNNGLYPQAEQNFEDALSINPDNPDALEGAGISQIKLRMFSSAKQHLEKAIAIDEKRWNAWNGLGVLADLEHDYGSAIQCYQAGLKILPNYPVLLNNLGYSLIMAHRYAEAEKILRAALSHAPYFSDRLRNNLGLALAWQGHYQEAVATVSSTYDQSIAFNNIGYIALLKKDYATAIEYFETAMNLSPTYYERAATNLEKAKQLKENQ